jgi:hypothetical protein
MEMNKLIRYSVIILNILICFSIAQAHNKDIKATNRYQQSLPLWSLILDGHNGGILPSRFRTMRDNITGHVVLTGLKELNMSGSAQFSVKQFQEMLNTLEAYGFSPNHILIVDLRGEPHAFINDYPIMWYVVPAWWTFSDPVMLVIANEKKRLDSLSMGQLISLNKIVQKDHLGQPEVIDVFTDKVASLKTEAQVVQEAGAHYVRIAVTDHMRPEDKDVDQFLNLVKVLPHGIWVHFHCHGGHGRTSTFMIMYDIIRNPELSLNDIIDRQVELGSVDLRHVSHHKGPIRFADHKDRFHFIRLFYQFVHAPDGYGKVSWSKWIMQHYGKDDDRHNKSHSYRYSKMAAKTRN